MVAVIIVLILVVALGLDLSGAFTSSPSLPLAVTSAPLCSVDINSTLPCGYAGTGQGTLVVTAAKIAMSASNDGSGSLALTLVHSGQFAGNELYFSVSRLGVTDYVQVLRVLATGQTQNFTASIPASFGLIAGQRYDVKIDSYFTTESQGAVVDELSFPVTAS